MYLFFSFNRIVTFGIKHKPKINSRRSMTYFSFLQPEFPLLFNLGQLADQYVHADPSVALMKMRLFGEKVVESEGKCGE